MKANKLTHGHNLMWESSRMMLPEHVEVINQHHERKKDVEKPILSDDQLEDIQRTVQEAIEFQLHVQITYYANKRIHTLDGVITRPLSNQRLEVDVSDGLEFLPVSDILEVEII